MQALFTKEALDASEYKIIKNNIEYIQTCAGKVNIKYKTKNIIGYILDKNKEKWKILLSNITYRFLEVQQGYKKI